MTARREILEAARGLRARGAEPFSPAQLIVELRERGSTYPESTLRTHIVSVMCVDAPVHHAARFDDLERVGHGRYRIAATAGGAPRHAVEGFGRESERAARRDVEAQERLLTDLKEGGSASAWEAAGEDVEVEWQLDDLTRRGYVRREAPDDDSRLVLTQAGHRATAAGLPRGPATRRAPLEPHELELLHQLLWDAAESVPGESRRRHMVGIKWLLEDHFGIETRDSSGPQKAARQDALTHLESMGAITPIGGGAAKRTSKLWVADPGMVQYPW